MSNVVAYFIRTQSIADPPVSLSFLPRRATPSTGARPPISSSSPLHLFPKHPSGHFCSKSSTEAFRSQSSNNASIFSFPFLSFVVACETFFIAFCSCLCASARKPERDQSSMGFSPKVVGLFVVLLGLRWNASSSFSENVVVLFTRHGRRRRRRRRRRTSDSIPRRRRRRFVGRANNASSSYAVTTSFLKWDFCVSSIYLIPLCQPTIPKYCDRCATPSNTFFSFSPPRLHSPVALVPLPYTFLRRARRPSRSESSAVSRLLMASSTVAYFVTA